MVVILVGMVVALDEAVGSLVAKHGAKRLLKAPDQVLLMKLEEMFPSVSATSATNWTTGSSKQEAMALLAVIAFFKAVHMSLLTNNVCAEDSPI